MSKKEKIEKSKAVPKSINFILQYLLAPIVTTVIGGLLLWLFTSKNIEELKSEIQIQNSVIQDNKVEIQELNNMILRQNTTNMNGNTGSGTQNNSQSGSGTQTNTQTNNFGNPPIDTLKENNINKYR